MLAYVLLAEARRSVSSGREAGMLVVLVGPVWGEAGPGLPGSGSGPKLEPVLELLMVPAE